MSSRVRFTSFEKLVLPCFLSSSRPPVLHSYSVFIIRIYFICISELCFSCGKFFMQLWFIPARDVSLQFSVAARTSEEGDARTLNFPSLPFKR